ncbi:unnamed protein product, partial [marine sediment metagenome]
RNNEKNSEIEQLIKKMLVDLEDFTKTDEFYKEDMKDMSFRVQWKICGYDFYQIFEKDRYEHKFGEILPNADFTFVIRNEESAIKFLKGELLGLRYASRKSYNGRIKIVQRVGWSTVKTENGEKKRPVEKFFMTVKFDKEKKFHPASLSKIPTFRNYRQSKSSPKPERRSYGSYIPVNKFVGEHENTIIPLKVFEHFLSKASVIVMEDICGCRHYRECKNHDVSIGCMHIGQDMLKRDLQDLEPGMPEDVPG